MTNHLEGSADKFIGGELWAVGTPVPIYSRPDPTTWVYTIPKYAKIGTIRSYVLRDSKVWWQLDNVDGSRWVLHDAGKFDSDKLTASLLKLEKERQDEIDQKAQDRIDNKPGFGDALENLFGDMFGDLGQIAKIALIVIGTLLALYVASKFIKK